MLSAVTRFARPCAWAATFRRLATGAAGLALTIAAACGGSGDGGGTTTTPPATPAVSIAAAGSTLSITQGATASLGITITRSGGFTGAVTITIDGLSNGVAASPLTIAEGQTTGTITLTATAAAVTGSASLSIRGTGTGVSASTSVALTIVASAPAPGAFTMSSSPTTVSLAQSGTATITVTIARTGGFTGAVSLGVTGLPGGVTAAIAPVSVTGTSATITLTATAAATAGAATMTITGSGTGVSNVTSTVALTVTAAAPTSGNVTWKFCGLSGLPVWVASQDGAGAWTRVTGTADAYSFNITSGKGGLAYVTAMAGGGYDLEVFYGTTAELQGQGGTLCYGDAGAGKTVNASIAGAGTTDLVLPTLGHSLGTVLLATSPNFSFQNVLAGNVDLIATRAALGFSGSAVTYTLNKMVIRRGLNPAGGSTLPVIDFNAAEAFAPVNRNVTISNLGADVGLVTGVYITGNNTLGTYVTDINASTATTRTYPSVPAANQVSGDLHLINIVALQNLTSALNNTRQTGLMFKDGTDKTVTLGPTLTAPVISTIAPSPYARMRAALTVQSEYNKLFNADFQQTGGANARRTQIQQTANYGTGTTVNLDIPDFSSVSGFDVTWGLKTGTSLTYTILSTGWTGSGGIAGAPYAEGAQYMSATRMGTATP